MLRLYNFCIKLKFYKVDFVTDKAHIDDYRYTNEGIADVSAYAV